MTGAAPAIRPFRCPRCGRTVLWLDGESSPALLYDEHKMPSSCEACHGKRVAPSSATRPPAPHERFVDVPRRPCPPPSGEPRPVAQIIRDDVRGVVGLALDLGNEAVDAVVAARKLWRKLKG
jgi:hypothetical protein